MAPAASFVASKHRGPDPIRGMVLGSDPPSMEVSSTVYGLTSSLPREEIDLLQTVPNMRDTTLDGAHRASMTEGHFLSIWDPYISQHRIRSASYQSASMLRDAAHRHVRSQYHPDEKYVLPPTVQNDIGWGLTLDKYKDACAKYQEGAEWHGRVGSHITKFSERLLLGARHHLSGPMTNPEAPLLKWAQPAQTNSLSHTAFNCARCGTQGNPSCAHFECHEAVVGVV